MYYIIFTQLKFATKFWYPMIWKFLVTILFWRFGDQYDELERDFFKKSYQKRVIFPMVKFENVWRSLGWLNDTELVTQIWQLDHKIWKPKNHDFVENLTFCQNLSPKNQNRNKINAKRMKFHWFWWHFAVKHFFNFVIQKFQKSCFSKM